MPNLVLVNLLRHVRHRRKGWLVTGHVTFVFPEHTFSEVITQRQLRTGNPVRRFLTALLDIRVHSTDTHSVRKLLDALLHFRKSVGLRRHHRNLCGRRIERINRISFIRIISRFIQVFHPLLIVPHTDRQADVLPVFLVDGFTDERVLITAHARGHIRSSEATIND